MTPKYDYIKTDNWDMALTYVDQEGYEIFQIVPKLGYIHSNNIVLYDLSNTYYLRKEITEKPNAIEL